jgi:hypothetical protein
MTETEKIQKRFERGYTMAVYGTREAIHKQMWEDIRVLLCENKALSITAVVQAKPEVCECTQLALNYVTDKLHCVKCGKENE